MSKKFVFKNSINKSFVVLYTVEKAELIISHGSGIPDHRDQYSEYRILINGEYSTHYDNEKDATKDYNSLSKVI